MNKRAVSIGSVFLVLSDEIAQALQAQRKDYPHLPDSTRIEAEITILNDEGGVPVVVALNEQNSHKLFLYTPSYALELYETEAQNGYRIEQIEPVNVQMYDQLAQGTLSLSSSRWHLCSQEKEIPGSQSSHWQQLENEWQLLQEQIQQIRLLATHHSSSLPTPPALPPHYERYLDLASALIQVTRQLDERELSDDALAAQQAAIALLKEGKASNPYLLPVLVDHRYQSYEVTTDPLPIEILPAHEEVVRKGLSVSDLLLISTTAEAERAQAAHVLADLIRACFTKRQRILLVAHSQQLLQDLLAQLPEKLFVLHLQPDDHSIQEQGRQIRQQLLEKTEAMLPLLTRLAVSKQTIDQWIERLHRHIMILSNNESAEQLPALRRRMIEIEQFISAPFQATLAEIAAAIQQLEEHLAHQKQRLSTLTGRHAVAEELRQKPALGRLLTGVGYLGQSLLKRQQTQVESLQAEYDVRKQAYQQAQETMQQVIREDPEYAWCQQRIQEIESEHATALAEATKAATILQDTLRELVPEQPPLEPPASALQGYAGEAEPSPLPYTMGLTLQYYLNWYMVTRALLEQRHALLQEWRTQWSKHAATLYPELLRYADVVAGTSSALAATKELEQIEFDVVIVDGAARMMLPDLLLPLVRARRAILVGDPQQGRLFDERAVQSWLQARPSQEQPDEEMTQQITTHLSHSIFEQLWSSLDESASSTHTARLITPDENQSEPQTDETDEDNKLDDTDKMKKINKTDEINEADEASEAKEADKLDKADETSEANEDNKTDGTDSLAV